MFFKLRDECTMNMNEDGVVAIETGIVGHKVVIDSEDFYMAFEKVDDSTTQNRELMKLLSDIKEVIRDNLHARMYKNEKSLYEIFQRIESIEVGILDEEPS